MYVKLSNAINYNISENFLELKHTLEQKTFRIKGFSSKQAYIILQNLEKGVSDQDIIDNLSALVSCSRNKLASLIQFLNKHSFLVKRNYLKDSVPKDTLYDRQIRFLDTFETDIKSGDDFNNLLQNRKVVIVGLGAYGTWLALHCSRLGIKNIVGIDFDVVELSNLHRQVLYTTEHIGMSKAEACRALLTAVDPDINYQGICKKIESVDDLVPIINTSDLVFNSFGYFPASLATNMPSGIITKACIQAKRPMLCMSTNWLGPFYIPEKGSACYFCAVTQPQVASIVMRAGKNPQVDKRALAPMLSMTCSLAILEATYFLSGIREPISQNGLLTLDPFNMSDTQFLKIPTSEHCHYCKENMKVQNV